MGAIKAGWTSAGVSIDLIKTDAAIHAGIVIAIIHINFAIFTGVATGTDTRNPIG